MADVTATWDQDLLGCPMSNSFALIQDSMQRRAVPLSGPDRYRRIQEDGLLTGEISVPMVRAQWDAFQVFYADTLANGSLWFEMELYLGTVARDLVCHFVSGYDYRLIGSGATHAMVTFQIECFRRVSTAYNNPDPTIVYSGVPSAPSPAGDLIEAGTPGAPSDPANGVLWGEDAGTGKQI